MYSFILETGGLEPKMLDDGGIELKDKDGQTIFVIRRLYVWTQPARAARRSGMSWTGWARASICSRLTADTAWINAEAAPFL